jgi:hypothetical protein
MCLTNNPDVARKFIDECEHKVIFKGASSIKTWATRFDASWHNEWLSLLPNGPALFQELISGPDIRVHVVGDFLTERLLPAARSLLMPRGCHSLESTSSWT